MKKLISFLLVALPLATFANSFATEMKKAMVQYESATSVKDFILVSKQFNQIAESNPDRWEPAYYETFCLISAGFDSEETGEKEAYLNKAEVQIENLTSKWGDNSEIWALKGLYLSARLMFDPRNAPSISPQISASVQRALAIAPNNPRALFLKIRNEIGVAQYMGKDIAPLCGEASKTLAEFHNYKMKNEWCPTWGQTHLKEIVAQCK